MESMSLELNHLEKFFTKTYSAASDFNKTKKDTEVFKKVLFDFNIKPEELIHIGDDLEYDVNVPKSIEIQAFLLCRTKDKKADFYDLKTFKESITNENRKE